MNIGFDYSNYEFQTQLANYIYSNKDINESILSKVLSELTVNNILIQEIKSKKDLSKLTKKERKDYDIYGRISFFKVAPPIEKIKKILSNPEAVTLIDRSLKETNTFKFFLKLIIKGGIYLLYNTDEKSKQLIKSFVYSTSEHHENNFSDNYDSFTKNILDTKLQNNEIENISESLCNKIVNSNDMPIALYFLLSLTEEKI